MYEVENGWYWIRKPKENNWTGMAYIYGVPPFFKLSVIWFMLDGIKSDYVDISKTELVFGDKINKPSI